MHDYVQIFCRNNQMMHGENFTMPRVCNDTDWAQFMQMVGQSMQFHCMRMFDQFGNEIKKENVWRLHDGDCLYCTSGEDWYNQSYPQYGSNYQGNNWRCSGRPDNFFRQNGWHDNFDWSQCGNSRSNCNWFGGSRPWSRYMQGPWYVSDQAPFCCACLRVPASKTPSRNVRHVLLSHT